MTGRYLQRMLRRVDSGDIKTHARNVFAQNATSAANLQGSFPLRAHFKVIEQFLFQISNPGRID
jgi:hypothetical protein